MKSAAPTRQPASGKGVPKAGVREHRWLRALIGLWLGVTLLKFGNPVILDNLVVRPGTVLEFLLTPWPLIWGYSLTLVVMVTGVAILKPGKLWHTMLFVLVGWFLWQLLAATRSIDPDLTRSTVVHFAFVTLVFWFGLACVAQLKLSAWFWTPLLLCFVYVLWFGLEQHYGGLEATRRAIYEQPGWENYPPEFLKKIATNRIFATLFYPNALAGVILMLGPVLGWRLWIQGGSWPRIARSVAAGLFIFAAVACLYWTGSKGGWLIAIALGGLVFLHLPLPRVWKISASVLVVLVGLAGFGIKYGGYLRKGAPSASARFAYWTAGVETLRTNPLFGSGPGTFGEAYKKIKPPEAEMARLTHNDYLQQFSDSGLVGGVAYCGFIFGTLYLLYRQRHRLQVDMQLVLLGLAAYAMQSMIEFNLYLPALAWPFFLFAGYLLGRIEIDSPVPNA